MTEQPPVPNLPEPLPAPTSNPQAGWYPDPAGAPGLVRYWNGEAWQGEPMHAAGSGAPQDTLGIVAICLSVGSILVAFVFAPLAFIAQIAGFIVGIVGVKKAKSENRSPTLSWVAVWVSVGLFVLEMLLVALLILVLSTAKFG